MKEMEQRLPKLFDEKLIWMAENMEILKEVKQHLPDLDHKFLDQVVRIDQIQAKVDLSMASLGQVQQEQIQVARALKVTARLLRSW